ncbi:DUF86 domain-containing protein [Candidatus Pacearchaeota archaeon]|nr:DUF86 domain-containing protein [Candidatus Pacearchaeota archaeon]
MNHERIESKIRNIIDSVNMVGDKIPSDFEDFLSLGLVKEGIYKRIEFAIECIIDICNIINSDLELGMPESEDQILDNLEKNKIFDRKTISLIQEMKKFRNILIHKYGEINDEQAFENIKDGLKDFETVINEIEKFLKKHK